MGNYIYTPIRKYGWKKDMPDPRDRYHNFSITNIQNTIKNVDMRANCPPIYDQGYLGSCTSNAIAGAYEFDEMKDNEDNIFCPSRLFIYYNERKMEGTVNEDSGAEIRDGIKTINSIGVCPESLWEYDINKFTIQPPKKCYNDARFHKAVEYKRVAQNLEQLKQCLINGYPFIFGFTVYPSMESNFTTKTGIIPLPKEGEKSIGGHAVMAVGFDNDKRLFIIRNSWGVNWGDEGYGYIPYDYLINNQLSSDFWTIRRVKDNVIKRKKKQ
jgi:C1A family cysteine protease